MSQLTIVIICRNRIEYACQSIRSALSQTSCKCRVVVSDNSTTDGVRRVVQESFPELEIWTQGGRLSHFEHVARVIDMAPTPWVTIFHDDDELSPQYASRVLNQVMKTPSIGAIACNSRWMTADGEHIANRLMIHHAPEVLMIRKGKDVVGRYLGINSGGIAPFNAYAFNKNALSSLRPSDREARHYGDAVFIAEVAESSGIIWLGEPLVTTRLHSGSITSSCGVRDYKLWLNWVAARFPNQFSQNEIDLYRIPHLFHELEKRKRFSFVAMRYVFLRSPVLILSNGGYLKRLLIKLLKRLRLWPSSNLIA